MTSNSTKAKEQQFAATEKMAHLTFDFRKRTKLLNVNNIKQNNSSIIAEF